MVQGNDIFDSRNVELERKNLSVAMERYQESWQKAYQDINDSELKSLLSAINLSMNDMESVAKAIFDDFEKADEKSAASKMARMDQKFVVVNSKLSEFRLTLARMQANEISRQSDGVKEASRFENFLGGVVLMIVILVTWFGHYMSKRMAAQEQILRSNAKMVALGEMAAGVAHEINNPLAIVRTRASQLRRLISSGRFEASQSITFLQEIESTIVRMAKIIDGLRSFSRSNDVDHSTTVPLRKLLDDVTGLCQERLKNHGVQLEVRLSDEVELNCRPVQIEQVLINLVNNAYDAIQGSENPWIRIEATKINQSIQIRVTDSGRGISDEIADKLMQPFFTTKPIGKGTGLGLSISIGIAEAHLGKLFLNRECENTQFVLELPLQPGVSRVEIKAA